MSQVEKKLAEMGLKLPSVAKPVAAYVPGVKDGKYIYTAGQVPFVDGKVAYELLGELFGEKGAHARSAVGVNELPLNVPCEVEMIVKVK